jgi:hypothetical protein
MPFIEDAAFIDTRVVIQENGNDSQAFRVYPVFDNFHILTTCDAYPPVGRTGTSCLPVVTHPDGTLVTADSPAAPGETVVICAFGIPSDKANEVRTGEATPNRPFALPDRFETLHLFFDASPNAPPNDPSFRGYAIGEQIPRLEFAGLVPGYVGLYQLHVLIPPKLTTSVSCGGRIRSNLTIDMALSTSFDGAPICVRPPP